MQKDAVSPEETFRGGSVKSFIGPAEAVTCPDQKDYGAEAKNNIRKILPDFFCIHREIQPFCLIRIPNGN